MSKKTKAGAKNLELAGQMANTWSDDVLKSKSAEQFAASFGIPLLSAQEMLTNIRKRRKITVE
jgi:hypothetical protein